MMSIGPLTGRARSPPNESAINICANRCGLTLQPERVPTACDSISVQLCERCMTMLERRAARCHRALFTASTLAVNPADAGVPRRCNLLGPLRVPFRW